MISEAHLHLSESDPLVLRLYDWFGVLPYVRSTSGFAPYARVELSATDVSPSSDGGSLFMKCAMSASRSSRPSHEFSSIAPGTISADALKICQSTTSVGSLHPTDGSVLC